MYLISVYFDRKTENQIQSYINDVASVCGNWFMIDNEVPPHITITAFETLHEKEVVEVLNSAFANIKGNKIDMFFDTHQEALDWGVQYIEGVVIK